MIPGSDRIALLDIARHAVRSVVAGHPYASTAAAPGLNRPGTAFVSAYVDGALRGCIGHIETDLPLAEVVAQCARAACCDDPRFAPITDRDLPSLALELSVLGPFERVCSLDEVEIGTHGLLAEDGSRRGLLLPQVATKYGWNVERFAEETCQKAGLAPSVWRDHARLWRFTAEVFVGSFVAGDEPEHEAR